jgi:hypothetical protein
LALLGEFQLSKNKIQNLIHCEHRSDDSIKEVINVIRSLVQRVLPNAWYGNKCKALETLINIADMVVCNKSTDFSRAAGQYDLPNCITDAFFRIHKTLTVDELDGIIEDQETFTDIGEVRFRIWFSSFDHQGWHRLHELSALFVYPSLHLNFDIVVTSVHNIFLEYTIKEDHGHFKISPQIYDTMMGAIRRGILLAVQKWFSFQMMLNAVQSLLNLRLKIAMAWMPNDQLNDPETWENVIKITTAHPHTTISETREVLFACHGSFSEAKALLSPMSDAEVEKNVIQLEEALRGKGYANFRETVPRNALIQTGSLDKAITFLSPDYEPELISDESLYGASLESSDLDFLVPDALEHILVHSWQEECEGYFDNQEPWHRTVQWNYLCLLHIPHLLNSVTPLVIRLPCGWMLARNMLSLLRA